MLLVVRSWRFSMASDYYKTLGIEKGASQEDIKRAFRKLAQEHHPDKGGDPEKFKEINEAYQILSHAEKRAQYDRYGQTFEQARSQGGFRGFEGFGEFSNWAEATGVNFEDVFANIFGGNGLGDLFGMGRAGGGRQRRGRDLEVRIDLEFTEAVFGVHKELQLERRIACTECGGGGAAKGSSLESCDTCGGSGRVRSVQQSIFGAFQQVRTCATCEGAGRVPKEQCSHCRGSGTVLQSGTIPLDVPAGVEDGMTMEVRGGGEAARRNAPSGNLYVHVRVRPDERFERDGETIRSHVTISAAQAALGDRVDVATVDGKVEVKIPSGTQPSDQLRLKGKGVPKRGFGRGDHIVTVVVEIPKKLSRKEKELWEELRNEH